VPGLVITSRKQRAFPTKSKPVPAAAGDPAERRNLVSYRQLLAFAHYSSVGSQSLARHVHHFASFLRERCPRHVEEPETNTWIKRLPNSLETKRNELVISLSKDKLVASYLPSEPVCASMAYVRVITI
jgi:hypothetical protein